MMFYCIVVFYDFRYLWIIYRFIDFKDHVYFVHPSTDISVDTSTDISVECRSTYRPMLDRFVGRYVDRHSAEISVEMCRSTY